MKKNVVRILALVLVGLMVLSLLPLVTYASDWCEHPSWTTVRVDPVCGEDGYTAAVCEVCGFTRGEEILPHTEEHDFSACVEDWDYLISEGNCLEPSLYYKSCSKCGMIAEFAYQQALEQMQKSLIEQYNREVAYYGAPVSDWGLKIQQATEDIQNTYTFKVGGDGHHFYEVEGQEATCTSDGWTPYRVCEVCGEVEGYETIPAKGHRFGEWVVTKEPTCTEDGVKERVCEVCGEKETEAVPALGHQGKFTTIKAPTCTEPGSEKRICTVCQTEEIREIPALGHKGPFVVTKEATCTEPGEQERVCEVCGAKETAPVPAAHKYGEDHLCVFCGAENPDRPVISDTETFGSGGDENGDSANLENTPDAQPEEEQGEEPVGQNGGVEDTETYGAGEDKVEIEGGNNTLSCAEVDGTLIAWPLDDSGNRVTNPGDYTYQWYRAVSKNSGESKISGEIAQSYQLTNSDIDRYVYCIVTPPDTLKGMRSPAYFVRKNITFNLDVMGWGKVDMVQTDGITGETKTDTIEHTENNFTTKLITGYTGDTFDFTMTPKTFGSDELNDYVVRTINEASTDKEIVEPGVVKGSLTASLNTDEKTYYVLFDVPRNYAENGPTEDADIKIQQQGEAKIVDELKESEAKKQGVKPEAFLVYDDILRYVTPVWTSNPTALTSTQIAKINGFKFILDYPSGASKNDLILVFHYKNGVWMSVSDSDVKLTDENIIVRGRDFSPFTVLALKQITLSFDGNGANGGSMEPQTVVKGKTIPAPACTFTKDGSTFIGWKDEHGNDIGNEFTPDDNMTLYAQWADGVTIVFDKNADAATGEMDNLNIVKGTKTDLTPNAYELKNFEFTGWNTEKDGSGTAYSDGQALKEDQVSAMPKTLTLYAQWNRTHSTITFDKGSKDASGTMSEQTGLLGKKITLAPNGFTNGDKLFVCWRNSDDTIRYKDGETISTPNEDTIFYAVWEDSITVHFSPSSKNGTGTGTMADQIIPSGQKTALNPNAFTAPALSVFNGWNPVQDGSGNNGENYKDGAEVILTEDTTLYAQWKRTAYTVTYLGNGGIGSMSTQTIPINGAVAVSQNGFTAPYGKTFVGWSTEPGEFNEADARYAPGKPLKANDMTEDLTLYGVWKEIITLHFDKNNENAGGTMADQQFIKGEAAKLNAVSFQAPTDYAFKYWTKTAADPYPDKFADEVTTNDVYRDKAEITVDADATLYAQWERSAYNVSFDKNSSGASGAMASQKFTRNTAAALNANKFTAPTGFAFKYWTETKDDPYPDTSASLVTATDVYKDKAEVNGEGNRLTEGKTLYAQWERVSYSVIYNANGGTGSMSAQTVMKDGAVSVSENKFTAPAGKIFIGWSKTPGQANTVDYEVGATVRWEDLNKEPFTDLTVYAVWKDKIIIHFDRESDSGTGSGTMADQEAPKGEKITLNANKFTAPSGMAFKEWNIRKDGTGTATYTDAQKDVVFEEDTTLYAQWLEDACTITFDKNDHEPPCETKNQSALKGVATKLDANSFETPAGKAFTGWNTKRDGSGTAFKDQATVKVSKDTTLYAQWINASTITFDKNAADATGTMEPQVVESGVSTALTANSFKRVNYQFEGWTTKADGSGDKYADKGNISTMSDTTLYAVWKQIAYAITYDPNGGGGDQMAQQNVAIGNTATIRECAYNPKPGEVFAYWQEIKNYEQNYAPAGSSEHSDIYYPGEKITPTRDLALKAVWVDELVLSYYPGEGSGIYNEGEVPKGVPTNVKTVAEAKFTAPANSTFAYWQDESGNKYYEDNQYIFNQNTKLTAIWAPSCTITYNKNASDVTGTMSAQTAPSGVEVALHDNKFSRGEYIFKYWTKTKSDPYPNKKPDEVSSSDVYKDGANITVTQDTNLYAQWYKTAITKGAVAVTGEVTGLDDFAVWGETLTAVVNDPVLKSGFTYTWQVDGNIVKSGPDNTYLVQKEDYGKTIVCVVSHPQATNEVESNTKIVGTYAESENLMIINNGNDSYPYSKYAYVFGVVPGTTFYKDGKAYLVPESAVDGYMEIGIPGTYTFGHATYYIENWYTVGYEVDTSGGGTVTMKNGTTTLTSSTKTSDIQHLVNTVWLVRDGSATDINITMKPASSTYVHWAVNGGKYSSSSAEVSRRLGTINQPMLFEIVFNKSSSSPKTGDMSQLGLWSALCFSSLVGAAGMIGGTRKRRKSR